MSEKPYKLSLTGEYQGSNGLGQRAFQHLVAGTNQVFNGNNPERDFAVRSTDSEEAITGLRSEMERLITLIGGWDVSRKAEDPNPSTDPSRLSVHEWDGLWDRLNRGEGVQREHDGPTKINLRPGTIGKSLPDRDESVGQYLLSDAARSSFGFDSRVDLQPWAQRFGRGNNFFPHLRANPLEIPGTQSSISDPIALAKMPVSVRRALLRGEELNSVDLTTMDPQEVQKFLLTQAERKNQVVLARSLHEVTVLTPDTQVCFRGTDDSLMHEALSSQPKDTSAVGTWKSGTEECRPTVVPFERLFIFAE